MRRDETSSWRRQIFVLGQAPFGVGSLQTTYDLPSFSCRMSLHPDLTEDPFEKQDAQQDHFLARLEGKAVRRLDFAKSRIC